MTLTSSVLYCSIKTFLYQGGIISSSMSTTGRLYDISACTLLPTWRTRPPACNNKVLVLVLLPRPQRVQYKKERAIIFTASAIIIYFVIIVIIIIIDFNNNSDSSNVHNDNNSPQHQHRRC